MRRFRVLGIAALTIGLASLVVVPGNAAPPEPQIEPAALSKDIFAQLDRSPSLSNHLSYTGVDPSTGEVEIGLAGYTPALAQSLEQRFGADRVRIVPAEIARSTVLKVRRSESPLLRAPLPGSGIGVQQDQVGTCPDGIYCAPTRGGVYLQQDAGNGYVYICSSTIVGSSRSGLNATLTAGHCFPRRSTPILYGTYGFGFPRGAVLGYPGDTQFAGSSDHMSIPWESQSGAYLQDYPNNCIFIPGVNCTRMNFNASTSDMSGRPEVTQRGVTTERTIGHVEIVSGTVRINAGGGVIITLTDMAQTSACSLPGDSGGAAFIRDRLVGTISAGNFIQDPGQDPRCNPTPRSWISKATNAYSNIGFSARLRP